MFQFQATKPLVHKREQKKKNNKIWHFLLETSLPLGGRPSVGVFLRVVQVKVQHQQLRLLRSVPAARSTNQPSVGRSDSPHDAACVEWKEGGWGWGG